MPNGMNLKIPTNTMWLSNVIRRRGETIFGMYMGIPMGCAKKCHDVESAEIPFYNAVRGIERIQEGPCRIIPKREVFSK